jgi:large subunit ribosomal protein L18
MIINQLRRRKIRQSRARKKITGTPKRPRLAVYRSNRYIYAQVIDDTKGATLVCASDLKSKNKKASLRAKEVGAAIAKACKAKKIESIVFDRSGFKYAGLIKILAEEARRSGIKF